MGIQKLLVMLGAVASCHAELIPVMQHLGTDGISKRSFIDSDRLKKLRKVDLETDEVKLSVAQAARIAWAHLRRYNHDHANYDLESVTFDDVSIRGRDVSYYNVWFMANDGSNSQKTVWIMLDGKVLKRVPEKTWKILAEQG